MPLVRGTSRPWGGPSSAIYAALCPSTEPYPARDRPSLRMPYQGERRVFVRREGSEAVPGAETPSLAPRAARSLSVLYAARRPPSVLNLHYKQSLSIPKLSARCSLQALQGTIKKQNLCCSTPAKTRTKPCELHIAQRRNRRAAANSSTPRWPTPTSLRSRRPRRRKKKRKPRPPP